MRLSRAAFPLISLAALTLHPIHAADRTSSRYAQPAQTTAAPTIQVYSRETVVDVTVTDKDGNPVHGLTRDDFTVKEDGKEQPIKSFAEFGGGAPVQPPPQLPQHVYTNLQPPPAGNAIDILLLDFVNTAPVIAAQCCNCAPRGQGGPQWCDDDGWPGTAAKGPPDFDHGMAGSNDLARALAAQLAVKREAMQYLEHMPSGTRVAVLGMGLPGRLRTLQGITSQPELLAAAVDTMPFTTDATASNPESWCAQQDMRNRMTLEVLNQIASDLAVTKGRKNLIWITVGAPAVINPSARPSCLPDYRPDLLKTSNLLTAVQIAVFPHRCSRGPGGPKLMG